MSDLTRIEERVKALFAQAEGAGVTEEEAEAFRDRAYALLAKYALDEAKLRAGTKSADVDQFYLDMPDGIYKRELQALLGGIARCFGVQAVDYVDNSGSWLYGLEKSIEQSLMLFELIYPQMLGAAEASGKQYAEIPQDFAVFADLIMNEIRPPEKTDKWKRSFATGYRVRIHERVEEQFTEAEQNEEETGETTGALVLKSDLDRAQEKIQQEFGEITGKHEEQEYIQGAVWDGHSAANDANIGATQLDNRKFLG